MPDPNLPCIYCWGFRNDPSRTMEHIWPQALGGTYMPNLFATDQVCNRCNSLAGLFVDGMFLKSWFLAAENTNAAHRFLDPAKPSAMPLFYVGLAPDFPCGSDEVCERWIGPAGDHIYHVHARDNERWDTYAGGDIIGRTRDPGRTYMAPTSQHEYWFFTSVLSFMSRFRGASHRLLAQVNGITLPGLPCLLEEPISEVERAEVEFLLTRPRWQPAHVQMRIDFAERLMCKLALGLSYKVLGPGVMETPYVAEMRRGLWTSDFQERQTLRIRGKNFWDQPEDQRALDVLHWPGAWMISLNAFPEGLAITVVTPGRHHLGILATEGHAGWPADTGAVAHEGQVYLVVPQRQTVVGPPPMIEYSSYKAGIGRSATLEGLKAMEADLSELPPKRQNAVAKNSSS